MLIFDVNFIKVFKYSNLGKGYGPLVDLADEYITGKCCLIFQVFWLKLFFVEFLFKFRNIYDC